MSIQKFSKDMSIVSNLDDEPNDVGGMTSAELKAKFDEGGISLKEYINTVLLPALEALGVETTVQLPDSAGFKYLRLNADKVLEVSTDGATWQATGSSGHLILSKDGTELPQRSRMKFANSIVTDENGVTVVQGVKGDRGETGATGARGPQGIQGVKGDRGQVFVPSVNDDGLLSWSIQEPTTTVPASRSIRGPQGIQGIQGVKGDRGDTGATGPQGVQGIQGPQGVPGKDGVDGKSFTILGMYATLQELLAAHPTGSAGEAYAVGTAASNTVYNWNTGKSIWEDLGPLRGPQGEQGVQGVPGPQGEQGVPGVVGPQGVPGPQGEQGIQGPEGPQGPRGYPASVNGKSADDSGNIALSAGDVNAYSKTETDTLLSNKAPAGYGLGTSAVSIDDYNNAVNNGWYYGGTNYPSKINFANYGMIRVDSVGQIKFQTFYAGDTGGAMTSPLMAIRKTIDYGATWSEWEYVNPPMLLGVEYRTTERYLGKPVYVKLVDCGAGPNNTEKGIEHGASNAIVIDFGGYMYYNGSLSIPWMDKSTLSVSNTQIVIVTKANYSGYNAYVWIKYYKTTD